MQFQTPSLTLIIHIIKEYTHPSILSSPALFLALSDHRNKGMNKYPEDLHSQIQALKLALIKHIWKEGHRAFTHFCCLPDSSHPWKEKKNQILSYTPNKNVPWSLMLASTDKQAMALSELSPSVYVCPRSFALWHLSKEYTTFQLFPADKRADYKFPADLSPQISPNRLKKKWPH